MPWRLIGHSVSNGNGLILSTDMAVNDFLGRSERLLVGKHYHEITHPDDVAFNVARVAGLAVGHEPLMLDKRYLTPDGDAVSAQIHISRLPMQDGSTRLVGTIFGSDTSPGKHDARRLYQMAVAELETVRRRATEFGHPLFSDHGWQILLETYLAECEARIVSRHDLAVRLDQPEPMIWRWLNALETAELVEPLDQQGPGIQLTAAGYAKIEAQLAAAIA